MMKTREDFKPIFDEIIIHTFGSRMPTLRERLDMRKTCGPYRWRPTPPMSGRGFYMRSKGFACGDGPIDLRLVPANDLLPAYSRLAGITGYYTDDDCMSETMVPIVARLNHGRGFLIGWTMGAGMCASLEPEVYKDAEDAARAAHSHTENCAGAERDYQREQQEAENEDENDDNGV